MVRTIVFMKVDSVIIIIYNVYSFRNILENVLTVYTWCV